MFYMMYLEYFYRVGKFFLANKNIFFCVFYIKMFAGVFFSS